MDCMSQLAWRAGGPPLPLVSGRETDVAGLVQLAAFLINARLFSQLWRQTWPLKTWTKDVYRSVAMDTSTFPWFFLSPLSSALLFSAFSTLHNLLSYFEKFALFLCNTTWTYCSSLLIALFLFVSPVPSFQPCSHLSALFPVVSPVPSCQPCSQCCRW